MTHQQILDKAARKALEGGWKPKRLPHAQEALLIVDKPDEVPVLLAPIIIFSHDFAKALWPGQTEIPGITIEGDFPAWQYQLQQMVIADDPIKYLGENIGV